MTGQDKQLRATGTGLPEAAMVLAAGLGKRMRPITERTPKPLVRVCGKPLIDHGLDALAKAGVTRAVVNVHHLADQIESHLAGRVSPRIVLSDERSQLLDSGGGIARALRHLGEGPFFVLNADSFWLEGYGSNLVNLAENWDDARMDALLLVAATSNAVGYRGAGDFTMDSIGMLTRRGEGRIAPFVYAGAAILHPRMFTDLPSGPFSLNLLFDRALERGRLFGLRLEGLWLHVGTPDSIAEAEAAIARSSA